MSGRFGAVRATAAIVALVLMLPLDPLDAQSSVDEALSAAASPPAATTHHLVFNDTWEEDALLMTRAGAALAVDPSTGRVYLFGGRTEPNPEVDSGVLNDLWMYDPSVERWARLSDGYGGPPKRSDANIVVDGPRGMLYMSGGGTHAYADRQKDLWAFDLSEMEWRALSYDTGVVLEQMGVMGGTLYGMNALYYVPLKLLEYDLATGECQVHTTFSVMPFTRTDFGSTFDPVNGRFYIFGGWAYTDDGSTTFNDLWSLSVQTRVATRLADFPAGNRSDMDIAFSTTMDGFYLYGGTSEHIDPNRCANDELWAYYRGNDTWVMLQAGARPGKLYDNELAFDIVGNRLNLYWAPDYVDVLYKFDVLDLGTMSWSSHPGLLVPPSARFVNLIPLGDSLLVGGGIKTSDSYHQGSVYIYDIGNRTWSLERNSPLSSIYLQAVAPDHWGGRVFVFGGYHGPLYTIPLRDLLCYNISKDLWTRWSNSTNPPAVVNATMAYSDSDASLYLFGGRSTKTWNLSMELWRFDTLRAMWLLVNSTGPSAREHATMVYDDGSRALLLFGGTNGTSALDDLWSFDVSTGLWARPVVEGASPIGRFMHAADFNPVLGQMIVSGGLRQDGILLPDIWWYSSGSRSWGRVNASHSPHARYGHAMRYNPKTEELFLVGGLDGDSSIWRIGVSDRPIGLGPLPEGVWATEDLPFELQFNASDRWNLTWTFETDSLWLVWDASRHLISGTPDNGDVGRCSVLVRAAATADYSEEARFDIVVLNAPPEILPFDAHTAIEDEPYSLDMSSSDDGQGTVVWSLGGFIPGWLSFDLRTGILSGVPTNSDVGVDNITITVDDGNGGQGTVTFNLEVLNTNDPPTIMTEARRSVHPGEMYMVDFDAVDPDPTGDILTWELRSDAPFLSMDQRTGVLMGTADVAQIGDYRVTVSVTDGLGGMDEVVFTLTVLNIPPDIISIGGHPTDGPILISIDEGEELSLLIEVYGIKKDMTYSTTSDLSELLVSSEGVIHLVAKQGDAGEHIVVVTVRDRSNSIDSASFTLTIRDVNDPPRFYPEPPQTLGAIEDVAFSFGLHATDVEGDPITWSINKAFVEIGRQTGVLSFTPHQSEVGEHRLIITASDGRGGLARANIRLIVRNINDAPFVVEVLPESGSNFDEGRTIHFSAIATDEDGDDLEYAWYDGSRLIGSGSEFEYRGFRAGAHAIELSVTDGNATTRQLLDLDISGGQGATNWVVPLLLVVILVAVLLWAIAWAFREDRDGSGGTRPL